MHQVWKYDNLTYKYLSTYLNLIICFFQSATPMRKKGSHFLNKPPGFETLFNFGKSLVKEKMRSRVSTLFDSFDLLIYFKNTHLH